MHMQQYERQWHGCVTTQSELKSHTLCWYRMLTWLLKVSTTMLTQLPNTITHPIGYFNNRHRRWTNIYPHTKQLLRWLLHFLYIKHSLECRTTTTLLFVRKCARKVNARTLCGDHHALLFIDTMYHVMKGRSGCFVALPLYTTRNWQRKREASFCSA